MRGISIKEFLLMVIIGLLISVVGYSCQGQVADTYGLVSETPKTYGLPAANETKSLQVKTSKSSTALVAQDCFGNS